VRRAPPGLADIMAPRASQEPPDLTGSPEQTETMVRLDIRVQTATAATTVLQALPDRAVRTASPAMVEHPVTLDRPVPKATKVPVALSAFRVPMVVPARKATRVRPVRRAMTAPKDLREQPVFRECRGLTEHQDATDRWVRLAPLDRKESQANQECLHRGVQQGRRDQLAQSCLASLERRARKVYLELGARRRRQRPTGAPAPTAVQ